VLVTRIGETEVVAGIEPAAVREAIRLALR
jgi:hypothetical protein